MKKIISAFLLLCLICTPIAGCAKSAAAESENGSKAAQAQAQAENNNVKTSDGSIDLDLTALNSTMVYAEVYNIMENPNEYMGKTIKMNGPYYTSFYDETSSYYHYVVIEDAAACCQQGLEFIWEGEHSYPNDYPADKTKIEVVGVFGSYEELGQTYYYLSVKNILIL